MKKAVALILSLVMLFTLSACGNGDYHYDPSEDYTEIEWPSTELVSRLPVPESLLGEINSESADYFSVDLGATNEQFAAYVAACQEAGFTIDYHKSSSSFYAYDADGYYVSVTYYDSWNEMSITIKIPEDEDVSDDTTTNTTTTTAAEKTTTTTKKDENGLRKEFKEAMDSYEEFMDDYVEFMKKYQANPYDVSLLVDYATFMSDYADMMEKFEKWEEEDLNDAELAYYLDVQARVNKKLLEVAN